MEIIENDKPAKNGRGCGVRSRNLFSGSTLIAIGLLWLLENFGLLTERVTDAIFSWQMLLTLIGGYLLSQRRWVAGAVLSASGVVLLSAHLFDVDVPFDKVAFPAILVAVGLSVIFTVRNRN